MADLSIVSQQPIQQGGGGPTIVSQAPIPIDPKGFWESLEQKALDIGRAQIEAWKHGGGAVSEDSHGPTESFNPFMPIKTAGYLIPQPVKDIIREVQQKNYAGAAGQAIPLAATSTPIDPAAAAAMAGDVGSAAIRGTAKAANVVLEQAPKVASGAGAVIGAGVGHALPIPGGTAVGSAAGAVAGKMLGNKLAGLKVPGENFGVEPEYQPLPDANGPQRAATVGLQDQPRLNPIREIYPARGPILGPEPGTPAVGPQRAAEVGPASIPKPQPPPESGAQAEARAYFEKKLAARKAAQAAQPTPEAAPVTDSAPSENDVAKGMGYKSADQAQQRLGPQQWQDTYKKIAQPTEIKTPAQAQQAVSDLVDHVAPTAPLQTKAAIDFALRKGDVETAQKVLEGVKSEGPRNAAPLDFRPQLVTAETKAAARSVAADALDDKMWKEQMEADYGTDTAPATPRNWANTLESQLAKSQQRAVPTSRQGRTAYSEAVKQFIENNKVDEAKSTLGELANRGEIIQKPQIEASQPEDLTPILKKSVELAKKRRKPQ